MKIPAQNDPTTPRAGKVTEATAIEDHVLAEFVFREYDALRAEVVSRLETQTQLISLALALLGGIGLVMPFIFANVKTLPFSLIILGLLVVTLLFSSIMWFFLENDIEMAYIGVYLTQLSKQGELIVGGRGPAHLPFFQWDIFRLKQMNPSKRSIRSLFIFTTSFMLTISRYGMIAIPAVISLIVASQLYFTSPYFNLNSPIAILITGFLAFNMVYLAATIPTAFFAFSRYDQTRMGK